MRVYTIAKYWGILSYWDGELRLSIISVMEWWTDLNCLAYILLCRGLFFTYYASYAAVIKILTYYAQYYAGQILLVIWF